MRQKDSKMSRRKSSRRERTNKPDLTLITNYGIDFVSRYEPGDAELDSKEELERRPGFDIFQRPDERVREDAFLALERHPDIDPADIEISVKDGSITLTGTVDNFSIKRAAEIAVHSIPGVRMLRNGLLVKSSSAA